MGHCSIYSVSVFWGRHCHHSHCIENVNSWGKHRGPNHPEYFQKCGASFWGNSAGQLLFLALATWLFCRVHVSRANRASFLRFQTFDNLPKMIGIAFVLILVVQPVVWFVAWLNTLIPMPHFLQSLQTHQMGTIKDYITEKNHLWMTLFNVALIPAFCEEILFRGYALRSFQKSWGPLAAIAVTGVIFGLFHLEPVNFLPLAMIGIILAYITWATRSIFPAMIAHFTNNALGILLAIYYPDTALASTTATKMPPIGLFILSIILSAFLLYLLAKNKMSPIKGEIL